MALDLLVALEAGREPFDHTALSDRDDRRRSRLQALAGRLEVLVFESPVADLAPDPAARAANNSTGDDARGEHQPDEAAR